MPAEGRKLKQPAASGEENRSKFRTGAGRPAEGMGMNELKICHKATTDFEGVKRA